MFGNFLLALPTIRYISYQEMGIISNVCVEPDERIQASLNDAMASTGA